MTEGVDHRRAPAIVFVALLAVTALACLAGFGVDRENAHQREARASAQTTRAIESLTERLEGRVQDLAGLFEASDSVTPREFGVYAPPVLRSSGASAIGFAQIVTDRRRRAYERKIGQPIKDVTSSGELRRAHRADRYLVTSYAAMGSGVGLPVGINLMSDPARLRTLEQSADSGRPLATPPIRLAATGKLGLGLYTPVYRDGRSGRPRGPVVGYALASYRFEDLRRGLASSLPAGAGVRIAYQDAPVLEQGNLQGDLATSNVHIAGRQFAISTTVPGSSGLPLGPLALTIGILLTVLLSMLTRALARSAATDRELAQSRERELELVVAHEAAVKKVGEDRFHRIFDSAPEGMALIAADGRYTRVNSAFAEFIGRDRAALQGASLADVIPPEELRANMRVISELVDGELQDYEADQRFLRSDGSEVWAAVRQTALPSQAGEPISVLSQVFDIDARRSFEQQLRYMADHDPLTGLANRRVFETVLAQHLTKVRRQGPAGAVLLVDLDHFKETNDRLGHRAGDGFLVELADRLSGAVRECDVPARLGGDEFAVLLAQGGEAEALVVAERIVAVIRDLGLKHFDGSTRPVTCSVGIALLESPVDSVSDALDLADHAMYEAKRSGGDRTMVVETAQQQLV